MQKKNIKIGYKDVCKWLKEEVKGLKEDVQYAYNGDKDIYEVVGNHYRKLKNLWKSTGSLEEINDYLQKNKKIEKNGTDKD